MRTSITLLIACYVLMCNQNLCAQSNTPDSFNNFQSLSTGTSMFRTFDNRYKGMKGTPMLLENYVPARIIMVSGMKVKHDKVNFDSYNNDLMVIQNGIESIVSMPLVSHFILEPTPTDTLFFEKIQDVDGKTKFFQRLYAGKNLSFVKKHFKELIEPNNTGAYSAGRQYAELVPDQTYFLKIGKELRSFKNKKTFLQQLPGNQEGADEFIKTQKVDFKNEQSVMRLVEFLDKGQSS
jgi:hypothetical protein